MLKLKIADYCSQNLTTYLVDGEAIRDNTWIDFTEGGNGYRYDFVPVKEIWIGGVHIVEAPYIFIHEISEITFAIENGLDITNEENYSKDHEYANSQELALRRAPNTADTVIKEAMKDFERIIASEEQTIWENS